MATTSKQPHPAIEFLNAIAGVALWLCASLIAICLIGILPARLPAEDPNGVVLVAGLIIWKTFFWIVNGHNRKNMNGALTVILMAAGAWYLGNGTVWTIDYSSPSVKLIGVVLVLVCIAKFFTMVITGTNRSIGNSQPGQSKVMDAE